MSVAPSQGKPEDFSFFYYKAVPLLDLLLNLWQNESDIGWLPCLLQLWTNSLCSHLVNLSLFPQLIGEAPVKPVCTGHCCGCCLQQGMRPMDALWPLCSARADTVSRPWLFRTTSLATRVLLSTPICLGFLVESSHSSHFFFAVFCVIVSCWAVVKKRIIQNPSTGPISLSFKSTS